MFRIDFMLNWFVVVEGMDLVVIDNIVFEDFGYVSKFDMLNKWKRYLDD